MLNQNIDPTQYLLELAAIHQRVVKNIGTSYASSDDPTNGQVIIKRPWLDEPSGSVPIDEQNGLTLDVVGTGDEVVLQFICPDGFDGVIKKISNNVNFGGFVQFSGDIVWRILVNRRAVRGFDNIQNEKGTIATPRDISPIRIYSGQIVQYVVNHVANAALAGQIICSFGGYIYPSRSID